MILKTETKIISAIVDTIVVDKPYFTNLTTYIRTYDILTKNVTWTTTSYGILLYERKDSKWKIKHYNYNLSILSDKYNSNNFPYIDGDIPNIELDYQKFLRQKKLNRILEKI